MNFGEAIESLKLGRLVRRAGWNGKGMWLKYIQHYDWNCHSIVRDKLNVMYAPFIVMKTVDDKIVPWLASQTDMLATDWELLDY